jgi:hypothetical protein
MLKITQIIGETIHFLFYGKSYTSPIFQDQEGDYFFMFKGKAYYLKLEIKYKK